MQIRVKARSFGDDSLGLGFLQIFEITADFFEPFAPVFGIAVIQKMAVTAVPGLETEGMFDGAPILFGASGDFLDVSDDAVDVFAIAAIEPFDAIEITQMAPVHDDIILAPDLGNSVNGETDELVKVGNQVQQQDREKAQPDDGRGNDAEEFCRAQIFGESEGQYSVLANRRFLEANFAVMNLVEELPLFSVNFSQQFLFERPYLRQQGV